MRTTTQNDVMPQRRTEGLSVRELGDELLVYDRDTDVAHCLTPLAARVWQACDGEHSIQNLGVDEAEAGRALDELREKDLLVADLSLPATEAGAVSRRQFVRRAAAAAAAAPLVLSVVAPRAEAQGSCVASGIGPCTSTTMCCTGTGNCNNQNKCK